MAKKTYRYRGSKEDIDAALRRLDAKERARLVKSYRIIIPGNIVEIETTDKIPELKNFEVKS